MIWLGTFLAGIKAIGAAKAALPEVRSLIEGTIALLHPQDQETAKAGLADLMAENDEGFARLDAKLAEAEKR